MLGHRGCRLGITYPEIYEMQARAIFEAACDVAAERGEAIVPEIMIPLVGDQARARDPEGADRRDRGGGVRREGQARSTISVGTMIELPRAALMAGETGRNGRVLLLRHQRPDPDHAWASAATTPRASCAHYVEKGIFPRDPFVSLDIDGVGQLVRHRRPSAGRATRAEHQARHLRRAWRRSGQHRLLRGGRARLRLGLALSRADRPAGGGAGGAEGDWGCCDWPFRWPALHSVHLGRARRTGGCWARWATPRAARLRLIDLRPPRPARRAVSADSGRRCCSRPARAEGSRESSTSR